MHKSGTSLIAATLHAAGIAILDGNEPDPHVERASTLNNAVLAMASAVLAPQADPACAARELVHMLYAQGLLGPRLCHRALHQPNLRQTWSKDQIRHSAALGLIARESSRPMPALWLP